MSLLGLSARSCLTSCTPKKKRRRRRRRSSSSSSWRRLRQARKKPRKILQNTERNANSSRCQAAGGVADGAARITKLVTGCLVDFAWFLRALHEELRCVPAALASPSPLPLFPYPSYSLLAAGNVTTSSCAQIPDCRFNFSDCCFSADFCVIYFIIIPFTFNVAIRHIDFDINCATPSRTPPASSWPEGHHSLNRDTSLPVSPLAFPHPPLATWARHLLTVINVTDSAPAKRQTQRGHATLRFPSFSFIVFPQVGEKSIRQSENNQILILYFALNWFIARGEWDNTQELKGKTTAKILSWVQQKSKALIIYSFQSDFA